MSQICTLLRLKRPFRHLQSDQYRDDKGPGIGRISARVRDAGPMARAKTGTAYLTRPGTVAVGRGTPKHGNVQQMRLKAVAFVGFVCPSPRTRPGPGTGPAQPISGAHHVYIERESRWFRQIRLSWKQMNIPQGCVLQETPPCGISVAPVRGDHSQKQRLFIHAYTHVIPTREPKRCPNSRNQRPQPKSTALGLHLHTHPNPPQTPSRSQPPEHAHKNRWFRLSASQARDMRPTARRVGVT